MQHRQGSQREELFFFPAAYNIAASPQKAPALNETWILNNLFSPSCFAQLAEDKNWILNYSNATQWDSSFNVGSFHVFSVIPQQIEHLTLHYCCLSSLLGHITWNSVNQIISHFTNANLPRQVFHHEHWHLHFFFQSFDQVRTMRSATWSNRKRETPSFATLLQHFHKEALVSAIFPIYSLAIGWIPDAQYHPVAL